MKGIQCKNYTSNNHNSLDAYRSWEILTTPAELKIRSEKIDSIDLIECHCTPFSGQRTKKTIELDTEVYIGIQAIKRGKETYKTKNKEYIYHKNSLLIWHSNTPSEFVVQERLCESALMIPISEISSRIDKNKINQFDILETDNVISRIIHNYLCTLTQNFNIVSNHETHFIKKTILDLTTSLFETKNEQLIDSRLSRKYIKNIKEYMLENIHDIELNIPKIAKENRISVRYLHLLFNEIGITPFAWLQHARLERCKEDLLNPAYKNKQISEICFKWGFNDPSHFSRCFKSKFGLTPREIKKKSY